MSGSLRREQPSMRSRPLRCRSNAQIVVWRCLGAVLLAHSVGCQGGDKPAQPPSDEPESNVRAPIVVPPTKAVSGAEVWVQEIASLDDLDEPILGRPTRISVDRSGRFIIGDSSDRNIKIYSADGSRVATFGRAGQGPGEFQYLLDSGVIGDRIFGYDAPTSRLTYFAEDGTVMETVPLELPQPNSIVATDENHLLFVAFPEGEINLLRIAGPDGATLNEFFPNEAKWMTPSWLWQHIWLQADALDGLIFAGMWGGKNLHVFDYDGTFQGSGPVDAIEPLISLPELVERNNGQLLDADGVSIQNGNRVVMRVVATQGATVTVQVAPVNTEVGADLLDGGTLIVLRWDDGVLSEIGRLQSEWGLLGRDEDGHALVMRYATSDAYDVGRVVWGDSLAR